MNTTNLIVIFLIIHELGAIVFMYQRTNRDFFKLRKSFDEELLRSQQELVKVKQELYNALKGLVI